MLRSPLGLGDHIVQQLEELATRAFDWFLTAWADLIRLSSVLREQASPNAIALMGIISAIIFSLAAVLLVSWMRRHPRRVIPERVVVAAKVGDPQSLAHAESGGYTEQRLASISKVRVASKEQLESAITPYLAQGFVVANRTERSVTLQKRKEFSALWAVIGFVLCMLPLLIYLIYYASQPAVQIVEISIA